MSDILKDIEQFEKSDIYDIGLLVNENCYIIIKSKGLITDKDKEKIDSCVDIIIRQINISVEQNKSK